MMLILLQQWKPQVKFLLIEFYMYVITFYHLIKKHPLQKIVQVKSHLRYHNTL